ncbi:MAG TPA: hypothetical protein PK948_04965 [Gemmatimonadales bacterium]|nr:hypothetical protein [Gemmatimonadales bacterium]
MAASHSDRYLLGIEPAFVHRVRSSLVIYCATVAAEAASAAYHTVRLQRAVQIINNPDAYMQLYSNAAALDATVIADATQGGTVAITSGNSAAQSALVTDAHLDAAIAAQFNFFVVPS